MASPEPYVPPKRSIKGTVIEISDAFLRTYKLSYENRSNFPKHGFEVELGYTDYSREDRLKTKGFYIGTSLNNYCITDAKGAVVVKPFIFYQRLYMNYYLKYKGEAPGFGTFDYYKKTKYTKERIGISLLASSQLYILKYLILEITAGPGIIAFNTRVPSDVTQTYYPNGKLNLKKYIAPNFIGNVKLGFSF